MSTEIITAIATTLAMIALEKSGENIGDVISQKVGQFMTYLKQKSSSLVPFFENKESSPVNYGEAILELETIAQNDDQLKQLIQEVVLAGKNNPELTQIVSELVKEISNQPSTMPNLIKLADKIGQVNIGGTNTIEKMEF
jgi:polyhydroxyalkanoate synthesis regulator phasin